MVVLWLGIACGGALRSLQMRNCVCSSGVGHRFWRRGGLSVVPCECQRWQSNRSCIGASAAGSRAGLLRREAEFVTIRIRAGADVGSR